MSYLADLGNKIYDQSTSGWFGQKMNDIVGDDYQKHLINSSTGFGPAGYLTDYQQAEGEGKSGWQRVGGNATRSAAILASIFGGAAAAGGEAGGGAGGAAGGGAEGAGGTGVGSGSGIGAENGGLMVDNGGEAAGGGSFDWQKMAQQFMGKQAQQGQGQQMQQVQPVTFDSQGRAMDALAQAMARQKQQQGQPIY